MNSDESSLRASSRFPATAWTVLAEMKRSPAADRVELRNRFIVRYWKPVFRFLRAQRKSLDQAEEWTQAFFANLLEGDDILQADRTRGKFRTFLLTLLKHFLSDQLNPERQRQQVKFEEGMVSVGSLLTDDERSYEPPTHQTPEAVFMRKWAQELLARVQRQVKELYDKRGQPEVYELFAASQEHSPGCPKPTQEELGARFGLSRDEVKHRLEQVKQSFRVRLRAELRDQVGSDADIDAEIRELEMLLRG
jgi:RNA polymerase sigma factor (sigma-70 family)